MKFEITVYSDVYFDGDDWIVNNLFHDDGKFEMTDDAEDSDIIEFLISANFLNEQASGKVDVVDYGGDFIEIECKNDGMPIMRLELL